MKRTYFNTSASKAGKIISVQLATTYQSRKMDHYFSMLAAMQRNCSQSQAG